MTAPVDSLPPGFLAALTEYVAIPSDSRSATPETMRAAAEWLAGRLSWAAGRVEETDGFPVVRGEWLGAPGAPTVLVYGHYDVQPTGDLAEWHTAPFELVVDGPVLRGRGVTDDKGPVLLVLAMAEALLAERGGLPLNVKFLLEGEEEIGSPHLPGYVRAHADELAADLVISADGAMWRPGEPSISIASKGLVALDIEVTGAAEDLHSGRYGGTVANPVHALATVLASLHAADGSVAVPGFAEGVAELSPQRRAEIDAVPFDDEEYRVAVGVPELFGEAGYSTLARLWERPTLEVNGITAGGKYTVIPHRAVGHVSCRLVGQQDPERVVAAITAHVTALAVPGVEVAVRADPGWVPAYRIEPDHPAVLAARDALAEVYPGHPVLLAVIAGTLPATTLFESALGAKTLFFSFATADEKHHAPNEFMRISRIGEGMRAWAALWDRLATTTEGTR
ncbi:M20 family dipeptidase [Modestobacter muralis]|uniref:M20 family dipeptidase n=1 Tax=Modestobacter muralis TaxID=1608614 RepID=A0A6P0EPT2_9ACTN|nr:M20/M25/M40 family metallo-hydrolase [Modestobacter muralis]NEK92790.1 M20 family dipeptidase [Modestobacter muralis]NEN49557.1 M20 family dipeptidase [Modestobacter muralis]